MRAKKTGTETRKKQIAQAALRIISEQGLDDFGVAAVARMVGVAPSAIYRHFKGKDEVLEAAMSLIKERIVENVAAVCAETDDPVEQLKKLLSRHVAMVRDIRAVPRVLFASDKLTPSYLDRKAGAQEILDMYLFRVSEIIRRGQERGRIRKDVDADSLSMMFVGMMMPSNLMWHVTDGKFDVTGYSRRVWRIFEDVIS